MKAQILTIIFSSLSIFTLMCYPPVQGKSDNYLSKNNLIEEIQNQKVFKESKVLDLEIDSLKHKLENIK